MSGLPEELAGMVQAIVAGYVPQRIVLFGSYARGEARPPDSDLDLLVVKPGAASNRRESAKIRRCLRPWIGRHAFTILPMSPERLQERLARGESFLQTILREGVELYAAN